MSITEHIRAKIVIDKVLLVFHLNIFVHFFLRKNGNARTPEMETLLFNNFLSKTANTNSREEILFVFTLAMATSTNQTKKTQQTITTIISLVHQRKHGVKSIANYVRNIIQRSNPPAPSPLVCNCSSGFLKC